MIVDTGIAMAAVLLAAAVARVLYIRLVTAESERTRRLGPDGVVIGGEGFVLSRGGAPAILLIHGAGDTPQTLRYLASALHTQGFHVAVPLLPGH